MPSGVAWLDTLARGLPRPGLVELAGVPGSGRMRAALALAAAEPATAWVDCERLLYPPAALAHGVDLAAQLWIQPTADRCIWAAEQVLRSGCFALVIVVEPPALGRAGARWVHAAEAGACTGLVLSSRPQRSLPADLRLQAHRGELTVARDRGGQLGGRSAAPAWPEGMEPLR